MSRKCPNSRPRTLSWSGMAGMSQALGLQIPKLRWSTEISYNLKVSPSVGQRLTLMIEDLAFGGEGVARLEDFVVFVPFVAVGEIVEAEVTEIKKRFARAPLVRVVQP